MPGVGTKTAVTILLAIGDGSSFGTSPPMPHRTRNAALRNLHRGEFPAHSGSKELKNELFRSGWKASCHDPLSKAYLERKRAEEEKHNAAIICRARRRCDVTFAMLKNETLSEDEPLPGSWTAKSSSGFRGPVQEQLAKPVD